MPSSPVRAHRRNEQEICLTLACQAGVRLQGRLKCNITREARSQIRAIAHPCVSFPPRALVRGQPIALCDHPLLLLARKHRLCCAVLCGVRLLQQTPCACFPLPRTPTFSRSLSDAHPHPTQLAGRRNLDATRRGGLTYLQGPGLVTARFTILHRQPRPRHAFTHAWGSSSHSSASADVSSTRTRHWF